MPHDPIFAEQIALMVEGVVREAGGWLQAKQVRQILQHRQNVRLSGAQIRHALGRSPHVESELQKVDGRRVVFYKWADDS